MKVIQDITSYPGKGPVAVAIGKFDGLHRGHQILIEELQKAKKDCFETMVFSFDPSPAEFFGYSKPGKLTTALEKRMAMQQLGIDYLIEYPFCEDTASISPEDYIQNILYKQLGVRLVIAGPDLTFGAKGSGDFTLLRRLAKELDFQTIEVPKLCYKEQVISSSLIREYIETGSLEDAQACLGQPYSLQGEIVHGAKLGRKMGMPTINVVPEPDKLLPPRGVYFSRVYVDGKQYYGMTNLGYKPTVGSEVLLSETYLYDFSGDLYGKQARIDLMAFHRPEEKFTDLEELKNKIAMDLQIGKTFFGIKG